MPERDRARETINFLFLWKLANRISEAHRLSARAAERLYRLQRLSL